MVKRPSNNLSLCGECHPEIAANYKKSLHYTTIGQRNRVIRRMSADEAKIFDEKVFETSCRSCHASCGDCHVKPPAIGGVSLGLISKHKFVRKDEARPAPTATAAGSIPSTRASTVATPTSTTRRA